VVAGFQTSPTQGLINLIGALVGFFFWTLYVRIALQFLLAVFRIAEAASPSTNVRDERQRLAFSLAKSLIARR